ncbi:MAG: hypothetical protein Q9160_004282 [Pyrenula sp. 1 TL-2023]
MADDADFRASSPSNKYRLGTLENYVPLNEEPAPITSTRGQRLPVLISKQSNGSLFSLRGQSHRRTDSLPELYDEENVRVTDRDYGAAPKERRSSTGLEALAGPQMRSMRLIGNSNPRYKWESYYKTEQDLNQYKKPVRQYYKRNNFLIAQYIYIDRLLDSSLPHNLIQEYNQPIQPSISIPHTITEEPPTPPSETPPFTPGESGPNARVKRTPRNLYKIPAGEDTPLLEGDDEPTPQIEYDHDEGVDSGSKIVSTAIYVNLTANILLLIGKIAVIVLTSSLSVLASLVDAALDFLSTAIIWITTTLIARQDQYAYPIGRRRLEPVGVLVFSVIMVTSFFQVALQCFQRLMSGDHTIVSLGAPSIAIMASTVVIKGLCWLWCRLVKNSSVQALAQDAMTDVVFNTFSIIFPLVGFYAGIWWLDALGGLILSFYVIFNWASTSSEHIRNLTGAAATADQRNVLLYLTMRFAKTIKYIQGLQAYHTGDQLMVEADIVIDENTSLRDSHDLGESLQYVLESVPMVDRAFVHLDYSPINISTHMNQQEQ